MAASYQLVMHTGPNQGKVAPLEKDELYIGRDLSNDIVINDAEVSRRHARLVMQAGGFVLEDLGSTNGTSVNGQRLLGPYTLRIGDVITLGEHVGLGFEATEFDPDATLVSTAVKSSAPPPPTPVQEFPRPAALPPLQPYNPSAEPVYAGQLPEEPTVDVPRRKPGRTVLIIALALLVVACLCGVLLWFIDTNLLWCRVFPFIPGCP